MKYIIGIDEVGRGCLAGPVTVTALAVPQELRINNYELEIKLKDSKKLSVKQREEWFKYIRQHPEIFYCSASVSPQTIDKINISTAANLAAYRAMNRLINNYKLSAKTYKLFLDGGLYLKNKKYQKSLTDFKIETVIKGDENIDAIKLASIVAKVSRDKLMSIRMHRLYSGYGFDSHKGYGTKAHRAAIKKLGISKIHRKTFCYKINV